MELLGFVIYVYRVWEVVRLIDFGVICYKT